MSASVGPVLSEVRVRPITVGEKARFDALLSTHHYLGFNKTAGRALRQVAEWRGQWLALLLWQAAAMTCTARDRWIQWSRPIQLQRLHLVANNSRFLILPEARAAHLASRVLGLSLRRLSDDWRRVHGHPLLLAETFVDPSRFSGTCYRAANWQALGETRGYARASGRWRYHGQPKRVWVYPLHRRACEWLRDPSVDPQWAHAMHRVELSELEMEQLHKHLRSLPEPRGGRRQLHPLPAVLTIALAATLTGARGPTAIAEFARGLSPSQLKRLRVYYSHARGRFEAPSEPTIRRVLEQVDPQQLNQAIGRWIQAGAPQHEAIAVDGKTLKGTGRHGRPMHLLSALLHHRGAVIAQHPIDHKSNEIPALRALLEPLPIAGRTITADALHTQRDTARFLVEEKLANYLFTVKANQPRLLDDLKAHDWDASPL